MSANFYFYLLIILIVFSCLASFFYYFNNSHKLIVLSNKLKPNWGIYKVSIERDINDEESCVIISPYTKEECLYYFARLNYQEKVIGEGKKGISIKFYDRNKDVEMHNSFFIKFMDQKVKINTKDIIITLRKKIINDVSVIKLDENQTPENIEEKYLTEKENYYILVNISSKKVIDLKSITISDDINSFKYDFFFHLGLIWTPTILFFLTYIMIVK